VFCCFNVEQCNDAVGRYKEKGLIVAVGFNSIDHYIVTLVFSSSLFSSSDGLLLSIS